MPGYDAEGKVTDVTYAELWEVLTEIRDLLKKIVPTTNVINVTTKGGYLTHDDQKRIVRDIQRVAEQTSHIPNAY
jgi:hypothetical protein